MFVFPSFFATALLALFALHLALSGGRVRFSVENPHILMWWGCWGVSHPIKHPFWLGLAVILCLRIDDARNGLSCRVRMTKTGQQS